MEIWKCDILEQRQKTQGMSNEEEIGAIESPCASKQGSCRPIPNARESMSVEGERPKEMLAWKRKALKRGKNRKLRIEQVYDPDNLKQADRAARKGKKNHKGVRIYDRNANENLERLQEAIRERKYHTSEGHECMRHCPCGKDRLLHKLPYYPDHIVHHALMQVIMPTLVKSLYADSSASIKGKGIHYAMRRTARYIDEHKHAGRIYYAKLDFVKFYHMIDQKRIYECICRTFGNEGLRYLLREVVTACESGLGIGLYPIQPLANFYLSWLCRDVMAKHGVRVEIYCDDIVVMSTDKREVWRAVDYIKEYADGVMQQPLHDGIGVQIIDSEHGLDFVGYKFFFDHTLLRKRMKRKFVRKMHRLKDPWRRYEVANAYRGWLMHCNGYNLWKKTMKMKSFKELRVPKFENTDADGRRMLEGSRVSASMLVGRELTFLDAEMGVRSKFDKPSAVVQVEDRGIKMKFFTCNQRLLQTIGYLKDNEYFPFRGTLVRRNTSGLPDYEIE